jgi:hypothetical protein
MIVNACMTRNNVRIMSNGNQEKQSQSKPILKGECWILFITQKIATAFGLAMTSILLFLCGLCALCGYE